MGERGREFYVHRLTGNQSRCIQVVMHRSTSVSADHWYFQRGSNMVSERSINAGTTISQT